MSWYKLAKAPKPLKYRINNDYARANLMFEEDGFWFEELFMNIPISQIEYNPWSSVREKDNMEKLKETGKMPPVVAYFDEEKGKYSLSDGNHRTNAAKVFGYSHVPAIVTLKRTNQPPHSEGVDLARMQEVAWKLKQMIQRDKPMDWIDIQGTTKDMIKLNMETHNIDSDYKYVLTVRPVGGGMYDCILKPSGEKFRGDLETVARQVASSVVGIRN